MWYAYSGRLQTSIAILSSLVEDMHALPMKFCERRIYKLLYADLIDIFTSRYLLDTSYGITGIIWQLRASFSLVLV